jgi:hypothetical protein
MHCFGHEKQSKKMSTQHVLLNLIGPNTPLQARMPTSPNFFIKLNHFQEELLEDNGLHGDLPKNRIEIEVLPDGRGGSI